MIWQLALWTTQLVLTLVWLWHVSADGRRSLWWISVLAALVCAAMVLWYLPQAYRRWLWRRRKSVRPSREVQAERHRIAVALHDDLGSQLVRALALSGARRDLVMQQALERCLLDLRLIVDSMDAQDDALPICMARFRHRLQPVLERRGIGLHWDVWDPDVEGEHGRLPRGQMAQAVMAVLQESVSNILQHSHANEIWITFSPSGPSQHAESFVRSRLCVEDNGQGLPLELLRGEGPMSRRGGMGLSNMYRRAHEIGGELQIGLRDGGGSCVCLSW